MLIVLLTLSLAALAAALAMPRLVEWPDPAWAHLVLAVAVMSLITGAMQHFVPVLCRSRGPGAWMARLPWIMVAAGGVAVAVFAGLLDGLGLLFAAGLGLTGALVMLAWMHAKQGAAVGPAHPGLAWYVAAMACLVAGLGAVAAMHVVPAWHAALRVFHLHINLYGFIGLTAIGTLQVLMPTLSGRPDPGAGLRLRQDLKWALAGAWGLALGQALEFTVLSWAGVLAWAWPLAHMAWAWARLYRREILGLHGGEPVLAVALLGFGGALVGALQGLEAPLAVFLPGFLFPLVTGAAGHLGPVWLRPGLATPWHAESRRFLNRYAAWRALFFATSALLPVFGLKCAGIPGFIGLMGFFVVFVIWLWRA